MVRLAQLQSLTMLGIINLITSLVLGLTDKIPGLTFLFADRLPCHTAVFKHVQRLTGEMVHNIIIIGGRTGLCHGHERTNLIKIFSVNDFPIGADTIVGAIGTCLPGDDGRRSTVFVQRTR